jgi:hypothetical protein
MLAALNLRGIQETLQVEDVMTDLDPLEAPVEMAVAPRKPAHDESWGTRILLGTATALTLCPVLILPVPGVNHVWRIHLWFIPSQVLGRATAL